MKELVILDVDNTLLAGQSQQYLLWYLRQKGLIKPIPFVKILLWFGAYKIGFAKNPRKIMGYAFSFLKGWSVEDFGKLVDSFFEEVLKNKIFSETANIIADHKRHGRDLLIVSNAIEPIIKKLAEYLGIQDYLCTSLKVRDNVYTGEIGDAAYGENKVHLIADFMRSHGYEYDHSWAYGDHDSDIFVLEKTAHPIAVNPSSKLKRIATEKHWQVLYLNTL